MYWQQRNKIANFLKHADRDPGAHIPVDEVDNLRLLILACSAYYDLTRDAFAEGMAL